VPSTADEGSDTGSSGASATPETKGEADGDPGEGVDFGWVMQTTFVVTILAGAPLVALLSLGASLPTWESWVSFAVRVGAVVWFCTAVAVYLYARRRATDDAGGQST
jgi:hypothetical protein